MNKDNRKVINLNSYKKQRQKQRLTLKKQRKPHSSTKNRPSFDTNWFVVLGIAAIGAFIVGQCGM